MNGFSFLGFNFSPVSPEEQQIITGFLERYPQPLCGYTWATLEAWQAWRATIPCSGELETLLIAYRPNPDQSPILLQPVGVFPDDLQRRLLQDAATLTHPLQIFSVSQQFLECHPDFIRHFSIREERDYANYVYQTSDLAELRGRRYSKKRNLLAQARGSYTWTNHTLTAELTEKCFAVLAAIQEYEHPLIEGMLARELAALTTTLRNFNRLRQQGLLITVDEQPVAFSIFEAVNPTMATVHFERALRRYKGLYQVINQETARIIQAQGFAYINREEDVGDEGLRIAKMSYHPYELRPAYQLTLRPGA